MPQGDIVNQFLFFQCSVTKKVLLFDKELIFQLINLSSVAPRCPWLPTGSPWLPWVATQSFWDAPGCPWLPLVATSCPWLPHVCPQSPLFAPGRSWQPLVTLDCPWSPLVALGRPWSHNFFCLATRYSHSAFFSCKEVLKYLLVAKTYCQCGNIIPLYN